MADVWLDIEALANLLEVGVRAVQKAIAAKKYTVREVPGGRGGKGGVRYEVLLSSLPEKAQERYRQLKETELDENVKAHLAGIGEGSDLVPVASGETLPVCRDGSGYLKEKRVLPANMVGDSEREEANAKAGLVMALRRLAGEAGLSDTRSAARFADALAQNDVAPELKTLAGQAGRGDGSISARSLLRWAALYDRGVAEKDAVKYLLPARRMERDWHTLPWAAAMLARWQDPNNPELAQVVRQVRKDLAAAGWAEKDMPDYDKARHWLAKLPLRTRERGRKSGAALKALLPYIVRDWSGLQSNDVWVGDGHTFKAKVCHPDHGQPFAPEVTFILDCRSRMIVGWATSLAENTLAVAEAIGKGMIHHGRPLIYYSDNGSGQTAKFLDMDLVGILPRFGVRHETGIPGNPQGRGIIERLWASTLIPLAKTYPTFQGKDVDQDSFKKVVRDINSARRKGLAPAYVPPWMQFVDDVAACVKAYNFEHEHRELGGLTPAQAYLEKLAPDSVMKLTDAEAMEVFRPEVMRTVQRCQVTVFNNTYFAKELEDWNGKGVRVLFDFADAKQVWVRDMQGRPLATAWFEANKRDGFDKALVEQLREKRVEQAVARLDAKKETMRLELTNTLEGELIHAVNIKEIQQGEAVLLAEAQAKPQRDLDREAELAGGRILEEEAAKPKPRSLDELFGEAEETPKAPDIQPAKKARPKFLDDYSQLVWLAENRADITPGDIEWMREAMRISSEFKSLYREHFGDTPLNKAALG